jgi:gas vesicle protein
MFRKNLSYLGLALAGGVVGAFVGLLAAPYSGRETRRRIIRSLGDGRESLVWRGRQAAGGVSDYLRAS